LHAGLKANKIKGSNNLPLARILQTHGPFFANSGCFEINIYWVKYGYLCLQVTLF